MPYDLAKKLMFNNENERKRKGSPPKKIQTHDFLIIGHLLNPSHKKYLLAPVNKAFLITIEGSSTPLGGT